ncbi:Hypothetical protein AJAP_15865 [Amycolatopsis japonica]|uniref:Uncharacterized protein n=1 Tax=Amycolatopsis japonica TaxID=208439 RepID=A0A075UUE0_9PSEU|nr:hypothetical protein [Amycolatopsis sp. CB00013]AIG76046.1 Hypothetical protein AJAP_15865 [Amycolatopsis japonica]
MKVAFVASDVGKVPFGPGSVSLRQGRVAKATFGTSDVAKVAFATRYDREQVMLYDGKW